MGFVGTTLRSAMRMLGGRSSITRPVIISSSIRPIQPWALTQFLRFSKLVPIPAAVDVNDGERNKLLNPSDYPPINWLKEGAVTEAKYQLGTGTCWAYVCVGALEGLIYVETKKLCELSVQFLVDRFAKGPDIGAEVWYGFILAQVCDAWPLHKDYGDDRLTIRQVCELKLQGIKLSITGFDFLSDLTDSISLVNRLYIQPVGVSLNESFELQRYQKGQVIRAWSEVEEYEDVIIKGVLTKMKFKQPHSMLLVGFNYTEKLEPYWLLRESAGPFWGEEGCAKVLCSLKIFDEAVWPVGLHHTLVGDYAMQKKEMLFNRWSYENITVGDVYVKDYVSAGTAQCPVVERLTNLLMMHGPSSGHKLMADAMEIIYWLTDQNPIHVIYDAVINSGPSVQATRISSDGVVRLQAVKVSPLSRVNQAIFLLTTGARKSALRNKKTIAECLADELIYAAKGSSKSYAIKKKAEIERVAKANC